MGGRKRGREEGGREEREERKSLNQNHNSLTISVST